MTTTPSDKELFDIEADALANVPEGTSHQEWYDRRRRVLFEAGLAAGRAEHAEFIREGDQATALRIDSLVRENQELYAEAAKQADRLKREQEATDAAEQKLAALVEGLRAFQEELADVETFALADEDGEAGDAALYRSQVTHLEDKLDALLQSAATGNPRPGG